MTREVDVIDVARALLAGAAKCYACDGAATRTAYGPLVDAPTTITVTTGGPKPHEPSFEHHYPYAACAAPMMFGPPQPVSMPSQGRWKWRCCDAHEPSHDRVERTYDDSHAPELRLAQSISVGRLIYSVNARAVTR